MQDVLRENLRYLRIDSASSPKSGCDDNYLWACRWGTPGEYQSVPVLE
jgi:hypothetical protein